MYFIFYAYIFYIFMPAFLFVLPRVIFSRKWVAVVLLFDQPLTVTMGKLFQRSIIQDPSKDNCPLDFERDLEERDTVWWISRWAPPQFVSYPLGPAEFAGSDGDGAELLFWLKCKKRHFILRLAARVPQHLKKMILVLSLVEICGHKITTLFLLIVCEKKHFCIWSSSGTCVFPL